MADLERIRSDIADIAGRRRSVEFDEIERIVNRLSQCGFKTNCRKTRHAYLFTVGQEIFGVCKHNTGRKELKSCYVDAFLGAMAELGLFEE